MNLRKIATIAVVCAPLALGLLFSQAKSETRKLEQEAKSAAWAYTLETRKLAKRIDEAAAAMPKEVEAPAKAKAAPKVVKVEKKVEKKIKKTVYICTCMYYM